MEKNFITNTRTLMMIIVISFLTILFLFMNIKIRNEKICDLKIEIEDLKEQLDRERIRK